MKLHASPLAAWLLLAGSAATLLPLTLEQVLLILLVAAVLSVIWLPGRRLRSAPFLLLYAGTAVAAVMITIPLPAHWHPLARLLVTLLIWGLALALPLAGLLAYLMRSAQGTREHGGQ
jgi:hypothetical protein